MRISEKTKLELYVAIHNRILDLRINLKLPPNQDFEVAQVIHKIWTAQKKVLKIEDK